MNKLSLRFFNIYHHIFGEHFNKRMIINFRPNVMRWDLVNDGYQKERIIKDI